jgi:hypothetical protein
LSPWGLRLRAEPLGMISTIPILEEAQQILFLAVVVVFALSGDVLRHRPVCGKRLLRWDCFNTFI